MNGLELFAIAVLVILFCAFIFAIAYLITACDIPGSIAVSAIAYAIFLVLTVLLWASGEPFVLGV